PAPIRTEEKVRLIDLLSETGLVSIEAASFVSPKWTPQMADGAAVMAAIERRASVAYAALTPNMKGYDAARAASVDEVAVFASASEGFSQRNVNASIKESFLRIGEVAGAAEADRTPLRAYVSCVIACPYDGPVKPQAAAEVAARALDLGAFEVSLGDTIGAGDPDSVRWMLEAVLKRLPEERVAGHYHDTGGRALANVEASLEMGVRVFDAAAGGLGGCPYAPGAPGNLATEALVARMAELGLATGVDVEALAEAAAFARSLARSNAEISLRASKRS
ncbi:MAG: hydroxymethylglutaryl-CoA lyase, partial [Pseudomonadota bacterium]